MSSDRSFHTTGTLDVTVEVDLDSCHRDPVHRSAHIQPHGTFLEVDRAPGRVRSVATNVEAHLGVPAASALGADVGSCFDEETAAWLREVLDDPTGAGRRSSVDETGRRTVVEAFPVGDATGVEILRFARDPAGEESPVLKLLPALRPLRESGTTETLFEAAVSTVRAITGFERVMLYRFDEDGHGTVAAEERVAGVDSYLGQRFPASDIPEPARRLYRENALRYIPDVDFEPVPVVADLAEAEPRELDLTHSFLRGVRPVHRQYLRNMGVTASTSIALVVDGELWGLIACHHREPHRLGWSALRGCELVGHTVSQQIERLEARTRASHLEGLESFRERLGAPETVSQFFERLRRIRGEVLSAAGADAFYLRVGPEELWLHGDGTEEPPSGLLELVVTKLREERTPAVRSLVGECDAGWEHPERVSGFLAARLGRSDRHYCAWFRPQHREEIEWGGDPRHPVRRGEEGELSPRGSFESWTQIVEGRCRAWSQVDRLTARGLSTAFREVVVEIHSHRLAEVNEELRARKEALERVDEKRQELLEEVQARARTDELTGLANRREVMRRLEEELERSRRYDRSLSVALLDLDRFKKVNDRYGHQAGDRVLERFAALLREETRAADTAGRYGGEEFLLVLPETEAEKATRLVERILSRAREESYREDGEQFDVTCSAGVTGARPQEDVDALLARADDALYRAKESGRDRAVTG